MAHKKTLEFKGTPAVVPMYLRVFGRSRRGLKEGESLPEITVKATDINVKKKTLDTYSKICHFELSTHLPITYPHILASSLHLALLTSPEFPLPLLGMVYLCNEITQHRNIAIEETLAFEVKPGAYTFTEKGLEFNVLTMCYSSDELVWESRSMYLVRKKKAPKSQPKPLDPLEPDHSCLWHIPANIGRVYGPVAGDVNPIHLNMLTAKLFGFKKAIAHGMWTLAKSVAEIEKKYNVNSKMVLGNFKVPIFIPTTTTFLSVKNDKDIEFRVMDKQQEKPHLLGKLIAF